MLPLALLLFFVRMGEFVLWFEPAALAIVMIYVACLFPWLGNFGKFGDFSYGIYIVHFPVVQGLVAVGLFAWSPVVGLGVASVLVLASAFFVWHLIEKNWLRSSSHYVEVSHGK